MESVERMKRRWNSGSRFVSRRSRLADVSSAIPSSASHLTSTIFVPAPFLHPPLFLTARHGTRIFPSFYLYHGRMHKYSRRIFRSNETYEKCKILSTRSLDQFFSLTRYIRVYVGTYIYIEIFIRVNTKQNSRDLFREKKNAYNTRCIQMQPLKIPELST